MIKRRDTIKTLSLAPFAAAFPATVLAEEFPAAPPALFIYDKRLTAARDLALMAMKAGHAPHPADFDETGFWRIGEKPDLRAYSTVFGATTRRAYFVFEQLSRLHRSRRLSDAAILHDDRAFSFWTLRFQPVH